MLKIPDEMLVENGGDIIREEREDGSVSYRPMHVDYGVGKYTGGPIPDMSRKPELAGQTVSDGEWERTYDSQGYCVQMLHLPNIPKHE